MHEAWLLHTKHSHTSPHSPSHPSSLQERGAVIHEECVWAPHVFSVTCFPLTHAHRCTHTWWQVRRCRRERGTEGGPCYRWQRVLSCALSHHWRLCGHGLMYEPLYGNRHTIAFSHYGVTVREWAQTLSVLCTSVRRKFWPQYVTVLWIFNLFHIQKQCSAFV